MPEDNSKKIKDLGLKALLEQGNVDKFFDVQLKERDTDSKAQLIGSIARIGDMLTQHSEGVFVDEISKRLSEKMAEMAEQLASGLSKDLEATEADLRAFITETDDGSKAELLDVVTSQITAAQANLSAKVERELRAALPELAESAKLTDDEVEDIINNASLSVESQMSEIVGAYLLQSPLSVQEIDGFTEGVQAIVNNVDLTDVKVKFDNIQDLPPVLDKYIRGGGKTQLRFLADVDVPTLTNGQVLAWNSTTQNFEAAEALPDQTGNNGKFLTTDGTTASWATLAGGGDMAAATYDPNTVSGDAFLMTNMNGGNWKTFYTNGTGDVTELTLGASGTYLQSNGATSAPTWETVSASVATLNDVGNVTITSNSSGEILKWNGTAWVNNTLAEAGIAADSHTHTLSDVTDSGALAALNTVGTAQIDDEAVTLAKMAHVATNSFLGRTTAATGDVEVLTATQARAILNVENNADVTDTANVTAAGALMDSELTSIADIKALDQSVVSGASPTFTATNFSGTAASLTAGTVTTNANLTGHITSVGNAAVLGSFTTAQLNTAISDGTVATGGGTATGTNTGDEAAASTTVAGVVELATTAETNTGTDTGRAVTPDGLAGSIYGTKNVAVQLFEGATDTATGDGVAYVILPEEVDGMNLVDIKGGVVTAGTTGTTDVQIHNLTQAADMLSTKLTIDSGETTSETAATAAVIDTANDDVAGGDVIRFDVDAVSTTAAAGLFVTLSFRTP